MRHGGVFFRVNCINVPDYSTFVLPSIYFYFEFCFSSWWCGIYYYYVIVSFRLSVLITKNTRVRLLCIMSDVIPQALPGRRIPGTGPI